MRLVYAPEHTTEQYKARISEHRGHRFLVDFTNGLGWHKLQKITVQTIMDAQIYVSNDYGAWWYPVSELWAYGTPCCLTCH